MSTNYNPKIIKDGLVLCLDAANTKSYPGTGTTWSDLSGNSNDGTLNNGVGYSSDDNGALVFDGSNDYVNASPQSIPSNSSLSLSVWINTATVSRSSVIEALNSVGGRTLNVHVPWDNNIVYFDCGGAESSASYDRITYTTSVDQRTGWHNWVFTKNLDTNTMKIYVDNVEVASEGSKSIIPGATQDAAIGAFVDLSYFYNGKISQLNIYNRALTATEIQQNFQALRGRYGI